MLSRYEDFWETDKGAWFPGERVIYRGKDLFKDMKDFGWFEMLCFGVLGRELDKRKLAMLEKMMIISSSFPDPRLWNNRVSALAGSSRSTFDLAISASNAVTEAIVYGFRPMVKSCALLRRFVEIDKAGGSISQLIKEEMKLHRALFGYGRPVTNKDERIEPLLVAAEALDYDKCPHVLMAFEIEQKLIDSKYKMRMNVAALAGALAADIGLTPIEYHRITIFCFSGGFIPCYLGAQEKPEGAFFPLNCERIEYKGNPIREWVCDNE